MFLPVGLNRPFYRRPVATLAIMAICLTVQVVQFLAPHPERIQLSLAYIAGHGSLFHLFSHMFTHGSWGHLLGNMLFLWLAGFKVEDALGWWKYTQFYLGSGIAANAFETLSTSGAPLPSLGASGAIAGLMGGFLILYPHTRIKILYWIWVQAGTFYIPAWAYLGFWFAKEYLFLRVSDLGSGIAFGAHVGGFTVGAIWMWAFYGWNQGQSLEVDYLTQPEESEEAW